MEVYGRKMKKKTIGKRIFAIVMALCIVMMYSGVAFAEEGDTGSNMTPVCGMEEHVHGSYHEGDSSRWINTDCKYDGKTCTREEHSHYNCKLVCDNANNSTHRPGDECYDCGMKTHTHSYYKGTCCSKVEHIHSDNCYAITETYTLKYVDEHNTKNQSQLDNLTQTNDDAAEFTVLDKAALDGANVETQQGNSDKHIVGWSKVPVSYQGGVFNDKQVQVLKDAGNFVEFGAPFTAIQAETTLYAVWASDITEQPEEPETPVVNNGIILKYYDSPNQNVVPAGKNVVKYTIECYDENNNLVSRDAYPETAIVPTAGDEHTYSADTMDISRNTFDWISIPGYQLESNYCYFYWSGDYSGPKNDVTQFKNTGRISDNYPGYDSFVGFKSDDVKGDDYTSEPDPGEYLAYNPTGTLMLVFRKVPPTAPTTIYMSDGKQVGDAIVDDVEWNGSNDVSKYNYYPVDMTAIYTGQYLADNKLDKANCVFEGWCTEADANGNGIGTPVTSDYFSTAVTADVTLYAKWTTVTKNIGYVYGCVPAVNPEAGAAKQAGWYGLGITELTVDYPDEYNADKNKNYSFKDGGVIKSLYPSIDIKKDDATYTFTYTNSTPVDGSYTVEPMTGKDRYNGLKAEKGKDKGDNKYNVAPSGYDFGNANIYHVDQKLDIYKTVTIKTYFDNELGSTETSVEKVASTFTSEPLENVEHAGANYMLVNADSSVKVDLDNDKNVISIYYEKDAIGGTDENGEDIGDGTPDKYQKKITYRVDGGYWYDVTDLTSIPEDATADISEVVTFYNAEGTEIAEASEEGAWAALEMIPDVSSEKYYADASKIHDSVTTVGNVTTTVRTKVTAAWNPAIVERPVKNGNISPLALSFSIKKEVKASDISDDGLFVFTYTYIDETTTEDKTPIGPDGSGAIVPPTDDEPDVKPDGNPDDIPSDDSTDKPSVDPNGGSNVIDDDDNDNIDTDPMGDPDSINDGDDTDASAQGVKTGDSTDMIPWALGFGTAVMLLAGAVALRRREE